MQEKEIYHRWKFTTVDGEVLYPLYTDKEIEELKKECPGDFWKS